MGYRCFEVEVTAKVAHVTMSRPDEYNSMVREFWTELPAIARELDARGDVRAMVLSSTGKHFTAGMDLAVFSGDASAAATPRSVASRAHLRQTRADAAGHLHRPREDPVPGPRRRAGRLHRWGRRPRVAADMRYASADAWFVIQEINIGMTADVGTLQRLPKLIPEGVARELAYTGRRMSAARAAACGAGERGLRHPDELIDGMLEIAGEIATKSPLAVWGTKQTLTYARDHTVADGLEYIATWQTGMFQPADMMEAFAAKAEKRDPDYPDLLANPDTF